MNKIFRVLIAFCLTVLTLMSSMSVMAASVGSSDADKSLGYDTAQGVSTEYLETSSDSVDTNVHLTIDDSDVIVSVPTSIILNGTSDNGQYTGEYSVKVSGDMSGDELLIVEPETDTVPLIQEGKSNISAVINQTQTSFDSDDLANDTVVTGVVSAEGLTAGSWKAENTFLISSVSRYSLYSSLELAASDANNLTTENADIMRDDFDNAVCGLFINDGTAYIRMFKDESNVQKVTFSQDTSLNLGSNALTFDAEQNIVSDADLSLYNGEISFLNSVGSNILTNNADSKLSIANVKIDSNSDYDNGLAIFVVNSLSCENTVNNVDISMSTQNVDVNVLGMSFKNDREDSFCKLDNVVLESHARTVGSLKGMQLGGNIETTIDDCIFDVCNNYKQNGLFAGKAYGILCYNNTTTTINSINMNVDGNTYKNQDASGSGIRINEGSVTINGDENTTRIKCFGNAALSASAGANLIINGGYFASPNHGGLYSLTGSTGSLEINGGTFVNNYNEYDESRYEYGTNTCIIPFGAAYIGAKDGTEDQVINIHNAVFINMSESTNAELEIEKNNAGTHDMYGRGIALTTNYGYTQIGELNLYDCKIYCLASPLRIDGKSTIVNLYGDTVFDGGLNSAMKQRIMKSSTSVLNDYSNTKTTTTVYPELRFLDGHKILGGWTYASINTLNGTRFTELIIPEGIEWINTSSFTECNNLVTVNIPDSVTKISYHAFYHCDKLTTVNMSDELLLQIGDDNRIEEIFGNSPCVADLQARYEQLKNQ